jgi:hypothetical protein
MYHPFARPIRRRPAYKPARLVVVIMTTFEMQHSADASQRHCLRPSFVAKIPADEELRKAPSVMSDEMSCCRSGEMLYPVGETGSLWPKTFMTVRYCLQLARGSLTSRKPFIAWSPPIAPKSIPYWNGDMETRVQARRHFQFSRRPLVIAGMLTDGWCTALL